MTISIDFGSSVIKVLGLETKYDFAGASNSFIRVVGEYLPARIVQQFHHWQGRETNGVIIDGYQWIYKSQLKLRLEAIAGFTEYEVRKAIAFLVSHRIIIRQQLHRKHFGAKHACAAYNRQYYYRIDYEALRKFLVAKIKEMGLQIKAILPPKNKFVEHPSLDISPKSDPDKPTAVNTETAGFVNDANQFGETHESDLRMSQINSDTTFKVDRSDPPLAPPGGTGESKPTKHVSLDEPPSNTKEQVQDNLQPLGQNTSKPVPVPFTDVVARPPRVEQKINKKKVVQKPVLDEIEAESVIEPVIEPVIESSPPGAVESEELPVKPKSKRRHPKTPKGTKPQLDFGLAPWKTLEQFRRFYRALIESPYLRRMARIPEALVQRIIKDIKEGIPHPFWDDFVAGRPIGSSTRQEWQNEAGDPHPKFIEYLAEKLIKGNNTQTREMAIAEALKIASDPRQAKFFWKEFKIVLSNISERIDENRALGVSTPNIPVWARERVEPTIEAALVAGASVAAVDAATQNAIDAAKKEKKQLQATSTEAIAPAYNPDKTNSIDSSDPWSDESAPPDQPSLRDLAARRWGHHKLKAHKPLKVKGRTSPQKPPSKPLNIDDLTVEEINKALTDPILRGDLTPQLMLSDYKFITDEIGTLLAVEPPPIE